MNKTKAPIRPETLHVLANTLRYTNQPAFGEVADKAGDTIASQAARIAELEAALEEIQSTAEEAQGEWSSVSILYTPEKIAPYKEIENIAARALLAGRE